MGKLEQQILTEQDIHALEVRVDELIRACAHLKKENRTLRERQQQLTTERAGLIDKTEQARSRVEGMIGRLKSLEIQT